MSSNSTMAVTCPTEPGLQLHDGLYVSHNPSFNFSNVLSDPTANWIVPDNMDCIPGWIDSTFTKLLVSIVNTIIPFISSNHQPYANQNYSDPEIQRHKVRVLLYPPVYSTLAFIQYLRPDYSTTIGFFGTLFEALAVYNLYSCLKALLEPYYEESAGHKEECRTKVMGVLKVKVYPSISVFNPEYKRGHIPAHGMFWCVKGPIMIIFYVGEILLSILVTAHVIKGTDGSESQDGLAWSPQAVKFGIYVLLVCFVMTVVSILMLKYFGIHSTRHRLLDDNLDLDPNNKLSPWSAFVDSLLAFVPQFFRNVLCCGVDSYRLARKRVELRGRRERELQMANYNGSSHAMYPVMQDSEPLNGSAPSTDPSYHQYPSASPPTTTLPPSNHQYDGYQEQKNHF
ncbi:hypothetical protein INT43_000733 [Umbelopsis isabellina]|uniref:Uncharacterized protein n=1 Tax=Mortierella isabellina TaxID=91625 RepID=A0A8H7UIX5_MORIS|nr:hypothetical protein INT43_000733 [Umbelopsis isabellina]